MSPAILAKAQFRATRITLGWNDPDGSNRDIILNHVDYRPIQTSSQSDGDLSIEKFTNDTFDVRGDSDIYHEYVLRDLIPDAIYEVYVSAENAVSIGKAERHVFFTKSTEASIPGSPSGFSAGAAAGVSIAVILIIIIVVIVVICIRKKNDGNTADEMRPYEDRIVREETRSNPSFAFDVDGYEDINDQDYEYVKSSKWDVSWGDLNLSGQILGKGNFGEVQLGKVKIKDRWMKAAVKTLKDGTPDSEKALFKEEFATMTRIGHHPNVVNILGSCEYAGSLYVILEYVPHGSLRKFLRKSRMQMPAGGGKAGRVVSNLNPDQLLKFAVGVAEAMKHISATGIIHRDLAARNVLVGKGLTSKVADFGMSREENIYVKTSSMQDAYH
ncbi:fibroblast growth factor receptor homolog 2-like [Amphiura filiformis]|uniref:fibroblast growth factor receptor homolog 2-like n=1 Tax=Amphiura filiformis TaxID=82378 RepID=UPI003B210727